VREIGAKDLRRRLSSLSQGKRHVARAAAKIENSGIGTQQDVPKSPSGPAPPEAIHVARQHVIQKIVAWRDGGEHVPNGAGGGLLIARTCRRGSDYGGFEASGQSIRD
jgi:hypothetical protein